MLPGSYLLSHWRHCLKALALSSTSGSGAGNTHVLMNEADMLCLVRAQSPTHCGD